MPFWPVIVVLTLRKSVVASCALKWAILLLATKVGWSLQCCHKMPDVFK